MFLRVFFLRLHLLVAKIGFCFTVRRTPKRHRRALNNFSNRLMSFDVFARFLLK